MGGELRGEDAKSITSTHYIWGLALFQALAVAYAVGVSWPRGGLADAQVRADRSDISVRLGRRRLQ